jgi:hypothetical protein
LLRPDRASCDWSTKSFRRREGIWPIEARGGRETGLKDAGVEVNEEDEPGSGGDIGMRGYCIDAFEPAKSEGVRENGGNDVVPFGREEVFRATSEEWYPFTSAIPAAVVDLERENRHPQFEILVSSHVP